MLTPQWQRKTPILGSSPSFHTKGLGIEGFDSGRGGSGVRNGFFFASFPVLVEGLFVRRRVFDIFLTSA
jgi:hypothetical protein